MKQARVEVKEIQSRESTTKVSNHTAATPHGRPGKMCRHPFIAENKRVAFRGYRQLSRPLLLSRK
jgi:hypothetical protein